MGTLQSDYSTASTTDIALDIDTLKDAYNNTNNTFTTNQRASIVSMIDALQTKVQTNPASTLEATSDSLLLIQDQINKAKEDLKISQDRVATIRNPNASPSYYESWFPIDRPLRNSTCIITLAFGIFFFMFFFLMTLRAFGFAFNLNVLWSNPETYSKMSILFPWFGIALILILIVLVIVGYLRKA